MLRTRRFWMPVLLLALSACGSQTTSNLHDETVAKEYYQGTTHTLGDDGQEATENTVLIRTTDVEARTVRIDVRTWTEGNDAITKNWLDITLTGDQSFSLTGRYFGENIEGEGTFTGEALGTWSAWTYKGFVSSDPDIRTESAATVDDAGNVAGQSLLFYGDGEAPIVTITDALTAKSLDDAEFAALVDRLMAE